MGFAIFKTPRWRRKVSTIGPNLRRRIFEICSSPLSGSCFVTLGASSVTLVKMMPHATQSSREGYRAEPRPEPRIERERPDPQTPESFRCKMRWELAAVLPAERNHDGVHEIRALRRLQDRLLGCLRPGEGLLFRHERGKTGRLSWGVGLLATDGLEDSARTADAVATTLRVCGNRLRFEQDQGKRATPRERWVELHPKTTGVLARQTGIGFGARSAEQASKAWEIPTIRSSSNEVTLADLVAHSPQVRAIEVIITPWIVPDEWGKTAESLRKVISQSDVREIGAPMLERLAALERKGGWRVMCRVCVAGGRSAPGLARLLGPVVFNADAEVVSALPKETDTVRLGEVLPNNELPILLPMASLLEDSGHRRNFNRHVPPLPSQGLIVGDVEKSPLRLPDAGRSRHTYIIGSTGTGKSTLLFNMIQADMRAGKGLILLDPHGDLYEQVRAAVPRKREKHVVVIDPAHSKPPPSINLLAVEQGAMGDLRTSFIIGELFRIIEDLFNMREAGGPMFEMYFRNALNLMIKSGASPQPTLLDFPRVFTDRAYRHTLLGTCGDDRVKRFWTDQAEKVNGDGRLENIAPYVTSKLDGFSNSAFISRIIGQATSTLQIGELMNNRGLLLVNLSKGLLGSVESRLLGMALMTQVFAAALERCLIPRTKRVPCHLYVDEFQNFVTDSVASMLSEARKFGLHLTLANQTLGQLRANQGRQNVLEAVLGNVGNLIAFRLGVADAELLKPFTAPYTPAEMQRLPNFHAFARVLTEEGPTDPVVMRTRR